jgi:hypothetical protein
MSLRGDRPPIQGIMSWTIAVITLDQCLVISVPSVLLSFNTGDGSIGDDIKLSLRPGAFQDRELYGSGYRHTFYFVGI